MQAHVRTVVMDRGRSVVITGITAVNAAKAVSGKIRNAAFFTICIKIVLSESPGKARSV